MGAKQISFSLLWVVFEYSCKKKHIWELFFTFFPAVHGKAGYHPTSLLSYKKNHMPVLYPRIYGAEKDRIKYDQIKRKQK